MNKIMISVLISICASYSEPANPRSIAPYLFEETPTQWLSNLAYRDSHLYTDNNNYNHSTCLLNSSERQMPQERMPYWRYRLLLHSCDDSCSKKESNNLEMQQKKEADNVPTQKEASVKALAVSAVAPAPTILHYAFKKQ